MEDKIRWTITLTAALVLAVACVLGLGISAAVGATAAAPTTGGGPEGGAEVRVARTPAETIGIAASVAFTTGLACVAAAYAVGKVGAAALGAAAERPELLGRSLLFVGLAEGIAIYGLIIAILLARQLG